MAITIELGLSRNNITTSYIKNMIDVIIFPLLQLQKQKADALGGTQAGTASSSISMPANLQIASTSRRRKRNVNSNTNVNFQVSITKAARKNVNSDNSRYDT